jgi:putative component of membrane protein insertase Oxa1/YidC/SpoIIIJ protein YidD
MIENEYEIAKEYCKNHELSRPDTDIKTGVKWLIYLNLFAVVSALSVLFLFTSLGINIGFIFLYILFGLTIFFVFLKKTCVLSIELYQHYASEAVRRKCVLMPSCSEYALQALQKYNVFIALYRTYIRLTKKCKGSYKIDYP